MQNFRNKVIADNKAKVLPMNTEQLNAWRTADAAGVEAV